MTVSMVVMFMGSMNIFLWLLYKGVSTMFTAEVVQGIIIFDLQR